MKERVIECLQTGLVQAYYLRLFLQLSKIPHYTTLQKFTDRINIMLLGKIISSFILFTGTIHIFAGIDSIGFKLTHASVYYTDRAKFEERDMLNCQLVQMF